MISRISTSPVLCRAVRCMMVTRLMHKQLYWVPYVLKYTYIYTFTKYSVWIIWLIFNGICCIAAVVRYKYSGSASGTTARGTKCIHNIIYYIVDNKTYLYTYNIFMQYRVYLYMGKIHNSISIRHRLSSILYFIGIFDLL